ncbi:hypothetical protein ABTD78_23270, partial [Acinetobacter baumannii]
GAAAAITMAAASSRAASEDVFMKFSLFNEVDLALPFPSPRRATLVYTFANAMPPQAILNEIRDLSRELSSTAAKMSRQTHHF